jgi:RAB protein geranylgeranyltransferase component A
VLQLEPAPFYGGDWATLPLKDAARLLQIPPASPALPGLPVSVDLNPKVLHAAGGLTGAMLRSNVGKYLEFICLERVAVVANGAAVAVPCSKEDVFTSDCFSLVEKRRLMKFLSLLNAGRIEAGRSILGVLEEFRVPLKELVLYGILGAGSVEEAARLSVLEARLSLAKYSSSAKRYGSSAFLYPVHGTSEVVQAFCRLCAVNGGIHVLACRVDRVEHAIDASAVEAGRGPFAIETSHGAFQAGSILQSQQSA